MTSEPEIIKNNQTIMTDDELETSIPVRLAQTFALRYLATIDIDLLSAVCSTSAE